MSQSADELQAKVQGIAIDAIQQYAQGILTVDGLTEQILREWEQVRVGEEDPSLSVLRRLAQRICSRELCEAWRSSHVDVRNEAFENLRRYLERSLWHTGYATAFAQYANAIEDVLHQTLEILQEMLHQNVYSGPGDPASFLKWTQTIAIRQAKVFQEKYLRPANVSLDAHTELFVEQLVDKKNTDPLEHVLFQEVQQTLGKAILSIRNRRYQQVLVYTYLQGLSEQELAQQLGVQVQKVYMWRHRALKMLRSKKDVMNVLRSLLE